jgi:hypothetical protein
MMTLRQGRIPLLRPLHPVANLQRVNRTVIIRAQGTAVAPVRLHVRRKLVLIYFAFHWREKYYARFATCFGALERYAVER